MAGAPGLHQHSQGAPDGQAQPASLLSRDFVIDEQQGLWSGPPQDEQIPFSRVEHHRRGITASQGFGYLQDRPTALLQEEPDGNGICCALGAALLHHLAVDRTRDLDHLEKVREEAQAVQLRQRDEGTRVGEDGQEASSSLKVRSPAGGSIPRE